MMRNLLLLTLAAALSIEQAHSVTSCLRCYSQVCQATNVSQLTDLVSRIDNNTNDLECCDCFTPNQCAEPDFSSVALAVQRDFVNATNGCCNATLGGVTTIPYTLNTTQFLTTSHTQEELIMDRSDTIEIGPGDYILTRFQFDEDGCIDSFLLRPFNELQSTRQSMTFTIYQTYSNVIEGIPGVFRLYKEKISFSLPLMRTEQGLLLAVVVERVCVNAGDTLGVSIENVSLSARDIPGSRAFIHNITRHTSEQSCSELNKFIETISISDGLLFQYDPLIIINLGQPTLPTTAATTILTSTSPVTTPSNQSTPTNQSTPFNPIPPPQMSQAGIIAIAAGVGGGVLCLTLLIVISFVAICVRQRKLNKTYKPYNNGGTPGTVNTIKSQRMQDLSSTDDRDVITVENVDAEESNGYDVPRSDMIRTRPFYHELEEPGIQTGRLAATGQTEVPFGLQPQVVTYDDPTELASTPQSIAQNPLYRTGQEASMERLNFTHPGHYHVPTALIRAQLTPPPELPSKFYHELEEPTEKTESIYTETAHGLSTHNLSSFAHDSRRSIRSSSVDTTLTTDTGSNNPLVPHYYHELENKSSPQANSSHAPHAVNGDIDRRQSGRTDSLERSEGHYVYEPGIYVPGGKERQNHSEEYKSWRQKSYKIIKSKKQFFEDTITYWEPVDIEDELYNQLSDKKYREILNDQLDYQYSEHLGSGQFGSVSQAVWSNYQGSSRKVAVKTFKPTAKKDAKISFLKEAAIMGQFNHSNIVRLYGVVTMSEPIKIVMELLALGDLDSYLYNNYQPGYMPPPHKETLLSFSRQVACGMKYLERKKFVHRDLAARNVLVSETLVCKIADFGMSRSLHDTDYYASKGGTVPIKWTAPEGLNYKKFSTASDVYSYGMVLYEIWSLGLKPLQHIKIKNVSQFVTEGNCQHPPPGCPRRIYEIMVHCWSPEQDDRPTFAQIFDILNGPDTKLLSWSSEDQEKLSNSAMELGAPLAEAKTMFLDLQRKNLVREDKHAGYLGTDV